MFLFRICFILYFFQIDSWFRDKVIHLFSFEAQSTVKYCLYLLYDEHFKREGGGAGVAAFNPGATGAFAPGPNLKRGARSQVQE